MTARDKTVFFCSECGGESPKWQGRCPHCGAWNSLTEGFAEKPASKSGKPRPLAASGELRRLAEVDIRPIPRIATGIDELDRVLGGGLVPGGVTLLGGDPGIGKSTLLLQVLAKLAQSVEALYVTGEESLDQLALRAERLGLREGPLQLLAEIDLDRIVSTLSRARPAVVVIDSIQTLYWDRLTSAPGSVAQVRECAAELTRFAKANDVAIVLVGHVTKEGALAGPRVLEHMVDTVLYFEGDTHSAYRLIRAFKNRFGAVNELGVFGMTERGLKEVSNPSALFLSHHGKAVAGSCVMATSEGTRPLLVEVQALVDSAHGMSPRRLAVGLEGNRLAMLLAVLHRHGGLDCLDQDVFVNAVGGVKLGEPGADLAVTLAVASSLRNKPLADKLVVFGEVGLAGEVRPVQRGQERLKEAQKLGFTRAIVPAANRPKHGFDEIEIVGVSRLSEALALAFGA